MQITKFTTVQNNHASGTEKYYTSVTLNKLKQLKSPALVASYDVWPGNRAGLFRKEQVSNEVDK